MKVATQAGPKIFFPFAEGNEFLGFWRFGQYAPGSICNEYGMHGNEYYLESIWNQYGRYGSEYPSESPWNEYSSSAPKLVDETGNYYGRFSINRYAGFDLSENLKRLYEDANGNLAAVRKLLCD